MYGKEGNGKLKRTAETDDEKWAWSRTQDPKKTKPKTLKPKTFAANCAKSGGYPNPGLRPLVSLRIVGRVVLTRAFGPC